MTRVVAEILDAAGPWPDPQARATAARGLRALGALDAPPSSSWTPDLRALDQSAPLARRVQSCLDAVGDLLRRQLDEIFAAPALQRMEAAWRGLEYLVSRTAAADGAVRVKLLSCTAQELMHDVQRASTFDSTAPYVLLQEQAMGSLAGEPFGALVLDHAFDASPWSIELLEKLAIGVATTGAPLLTSASPAMFRATAFAELRERRDVGLIFDGVEYAKWRALRQMSGRWGGQASVHLFLCMPRVLLRAPAAAPDLPDGAPAIDDGCWGSAAFAVAGALADDFAATGWPYPLAPATERVRDGLPERRAEDEFENTVFTPIEVVLGERHRAQLMDAGFTVLAPRADTTARPTDDAVSCRLPRRVDGERPIAGVLSPRTLRRVAAIARLRQLVSRILLTRTFDSADDVCSYLMAWIAPHIVPNDSAFADAASAAPFVAVRFEVVPGSFRGLLVPMPNEVYAAGWRVLVEAEVRDPAPIPAPAVRRP